MLFVRVFLLISILSCFWYHIYMSLCVYSRISRVRKRKLFSFYSFFVDDDDDSNSCVALHVRIANRLVTDSRCRGGIVNTRGGCSRARSVRPESSKALWRFRVSTSNSLSGRDMPLANTPMLQIYHTYAQQDIRECGDDHLQPPKRQYPNPKALSLLRISI